MKIYRGCLLFTCLTFILISCTPKIYRGKNDIYGEQAKQFAAVIAAPPRDSVVADSLKHPAGRILTSNFGMRKPNLVVIHYTAQNSCEKTLETFTTKEREVSAHYVICKDGTLHHMLNDYLRAWHAGVSKWGSNTDVNSSSIGIEIDNNGVDSFSSAQLNTLYGVLNYVKKAYNIPSANFVGHSDVSPGRKVDPGPLFPWKILAEKGYGLWYSDTTGINVPADFNEKIALKLIGYDVSNLSAAMQAFRSHFTGLGVAGELSVPERKILFILMRQYL